MKIQKRSIEFEIDDSDAYIRNWFLNVYPSWEKSTFDVLDHFLIRDESFIDIGSWMGPLALYAAARCKHVYCLEPDPVAYSRLQRNIKQNSQYSNVSTFNLGIANFEGSVLFGGNGQLGNSESTLLVNDSEFLKNGGEDLHWKGDDEEWRVGETVRAEMTTFDKFVQNNNIDLAKICLIKIDVEGGEKILIPSMASLLKKNRTNIYLSLHWVFISKEDIVSILEILYDIYPFITNSDFKVISKDEAIDHHISEVICTFQEVQT